MRLVAITDLHGNVKMSRKLAGLIVEKKPDALLMAGDITHFSGAETARKVLQPLIETGVPILAVHGNCDGRDVPGLLEELGVWLHDRRGELGGVGFVGLGGSNVTPFNTVWELAEDEIREILRRNHRPGDIILSHVPPKNTKADRVHSGLHVGSPALREFIEENQPPLVVTGHIHEARSVDRVGEKRVKNVELLRI